MKPGKLILVTVVLVALGAFYWLDLGRYLQFEYIKAQHDALSAYAASHPWQSAVIYFVAYVLMAGLSLPGAALLTLAGASVLGFWKALVLVSFASTLGATLAFLIARYLFRDAVQTRFGNRLKAINEGLEHDGPFYLFGLRLVPLFPFFVINLLMGLTPLKTWTFYWVSQVGMLAGTAVYVNAGTRLSELDSPAGILSPGLIVSFALLGVFPLIAKWGLSAVKRRRALAAWQKPGRFDRNLIVIGAGSAGLVTAYIAAALKSKVSLIEKGKMGGDCLNTGCVPSKALIRSARVASLLRRAGEFGIKTTSTEVDFAQVMQRVRDVVAKVEPHDSVDRYTKLGVDCIAGNAIVRSPYEVEVDGRILTTRNIVVATGASPFVPLIPGLEQIDFLTSDNLWQLRELPPRLLVLGGGPIGCELAQAFGRLGSRVTQVEMAPRLLAREDEDVSAALLAQFSSEGIDVRLEHKALSFRMDPERALVCEHHAQEVLIPFDEVLVAVGRRAHTADLGLEALGVALNPNGTIRTNEYLQTDCPTLYACGDVVGPYQFTHTAAHQAWYATVNALFGGLKRFRVDYSVIPHATFTEPEVARVGLNEQDAKAQGIAYEVTRYELNDLDRAIAEGADRGFVKVLTATGRDRVLGATIVGENAGELISEFTAAMRNGYGLNRILSTIHIYPTLAEANKYAAGQWKRAHAPEGLLAWLARFHAWRRG